MRQIKFRGKRTDTGEWIYGDLLTSNGTECEISDWNDVVYSRYDVDPDTVGQFTGLLDKNGKEVYEGDIITDSDGDVGQMCWDEGCLEYYTQYNDGLQDRFSCWHPCEVVGNNFDNPELMEGGEE